MVETGNSRGVSGMTVTLVECTVGTTDVPGVPPPRPGHQFLYTRWFYQNNTDHVVAAGKTEAIVGDRSYEARLFDGPANIRPGRPGQAGYARWWFELPVSAREVSLVYTSADGAKAEWQRTLR